MGLLWESAVVIAAAIVQSLGLTIQRLSHLDPSVQRATEEASSAVSSTTTITTTAPLESGENYGDRESAQQTHNVLKNPVILWRAGIAMFILANIFGSTVQLAILPLVLVSTLQATGLVANSVLACLILKEPITLKAAIGTVLIGCGAALVAGLGNVQADPYPSLDELFKFIWTPRFMLWMVITITGAVALGQYARHLALRDRSTHKQHNNKLGWLWGITAGIASAHSLLMAKLSIGVLIRKFPDILTDLLRPKLWVLTGSFLIFALSQMWCVNCGLRYISTSVLYPLIFCVYNVATLVNSIVLYESTSSLRKENLLWVVLGTTVLISGVLLLSSRFEDDTTRINDSQDGDFIDSGIPRWLSRSQSQRISLGTLNTLPHAGSSSSLSPFPPSPISPGLSRTPGAVQSPLSIHDSSLPLLDSSSYTSFDSISPNITNPDKMRGRSAHRVLSKEQHQILRELGV